MSSPTEDALTDLSSCVGNTILTASGMYFDFVNVRPDLISSYDIGYALGNICRFNGHCTFYSVAEHCVHCCEVAEEMYPDDIELHFAALMHDAAEAYIGDVSKPLKVMLPDFRKIEARVEAAIDEKFGIDTSKQSIVKHIDLCMLKVEKAQLFLNDRAQWTGFAELPDIKCTLQFWKPSVASESFLAKYYDVTERRAIDV